MRNNHFHPGPPVFLALAVLCFLVILLSRESLQSKGVPAFSCQEEDLVYVGLVAEGLSSGVRQFSGDATLLDVINLTGVNGEADFETDSLWTRPLVTGENLKFEKKGRKIKLLHEGWIAASQRIALGIALHPDQMAENDWTALPGIGPVLAKRIENNRQKNGDFSSFNELLRVKGIGKKSIAKWSDFF